MGIQSNFLTIFPVYCRVKYFLTVLKQLIIWQAVTASAQSHFPQQIIQNRACLTEAGITVQDKECLFISLRTH
jgi:hypothetical protein